VISPNTATAAAQAIRRGHQGPGHDDGDACEELARRLDREADLFRTQLSPLDMAGNLAAKVQAYAEALNDDDPDRRLQAQIAQAGERAHAGAQLAANLALVSIAQDLHQVAQAIVHVGEAVTMDRADPEPWTLSGAVADARRTREHMRAWAKGEQDHPGEEGQ
jgi:hypothetical protein